MCGPWTQSLNAGGHLFTPAQTRLAPLCWSVNVCVTWLHVWAHLSLCLFLCVQEYKESPRSDRISHSERGEDRHGLPSAEDHVSSDSEGTQGPGFIHSIQTVFNSIPTIQAAFFFISKGSMSYLKSTKNMLICPLQNTRLTPPPHSALSKYFFLNEALVQNETKVSGTNVRMENVGGNNDSILSVK